MLVEIGSEFYQTEMSSKKILKQNKKTKFLLSGRTALDYVIKDILSQQNIKTAYFPSYCCHTMIEPFLASNVKIEFYDVLVSENGGIKSQVDLDKKCDVVFLIQYFGFHDKSVLDTARIFRNKGTIVIEDITHSMLLSATNVSVEIADYIFGSFKKWTTLYSGGFAYKRTGIFEHEVQNLTNNEYIALRKVSVNLKKSYMQGKITDKLFLESFANAENLLERDYRNYKMDKESFYLLQSIDTVLIKDKRRSNALFLLEKLKDSKIVNPIFTYINDIDVPLFFPVLVNYRLRDNLREYLVSNQIYCPVHWPLSEHHLISEQSRCIYENMLSIVCDQRYGHDEMNYISQKIHEFEVKQCL